MSAKNRYTKEFRSEVVEKIKAGAKGVDVAQAYGIKAELVYKWVSLSTLGGERTSEIGKLVRENRSLKELVGELAMELKRFKKN